MKRVLMIALVGMMIAMPSPARAFDLWEWLSGFSGAGPFDGGDIPALSAALCRQESKWKPSPVGRDAESSERKIMPCLFVDRTNFRVDADPRQGYPEIEIAMYDFGAHARLYDWLDVGAGAGWMAINNKGTNVTQRRFVVTPGILVRPGLIGRNGTRNHYWGAIGFYAKVVSVPGELEGRRDFGQSPPLGVAEFRKSNDVLRAAGVIVDVTALIPRKSR